VYSPPNHSPEEINNRTASTSCRPALLPLVQPQGRASGQVQNPPFWGVIIIIIISITHCFFPISHLYFCFFFFGCSFYYYLFIIYYLLFIIYYAFFLLTSSSASFSLGLCCEPQGGPRPPSAPPLSSASSPSASRVAYFWFFPEGR
jgi:hypothetical protein